jgi:hypothetical protein
MKLFYVNNSLIQQPQNTAENIAAAVLVPAGKFVNKIVHVTFNTSKTTSFTQAQTLRMHINTAPNLSGATLIALSAGASGTRLLSIERHLLVNSNQIIHTNSATSHVTDIASLTTAVEHVTTSYNFTQPVYFIFTTQINDTAAIIYVQTILIETT